MDEKKVREEYLEFPWGIEDTIENLRELKSILQKQVREVNYDGKGTQDAFEVGFDFDRAIEALEKQLPKKPKEIKNQTLIEAGWKYECPVCKCACGENKYHYEITKDDFYCTNCGQLLDWSEE